MPMKIATWNACLGLFHKKDYVRQLLELNDIDILSLQETELDPNITPEILHIRGYNVEVEENEKKIRVAVYLKNKIQYKRRKDLEMKNHHTIILDVGRTRIINIYRTFKPQDNLSPRENFKSQLRQINDATNVSTFILGDFNLNEQKRFKVDYVQRQLFEDFDNQR